LPLLISRRAILLDQRNLIAQLCQLERRTSRGGRDSVDHPQGGRDDIANSACGVLWQLAQNLGPTLLDPAQMKAEEPAASQIVAGYVWLHESEAAVVYASSAYWLKEMHILSFAVGPYHDGLFDEVVMKARDLAIQRRSQCGAALLVMPELKARAIRAATKRAMDDGAIVVSVVEETSEEFDPKDPGLHTLAAKHGEFIRLAPEAFEQAKAHPLAAALSFRAGDKAALCA
jgi:hypothetical protein